VDYSDDSSDNEKDYITTKYKIAIQSRMHRVEASPRLLPYYVMVRWALDHVDTPTRTIMNKKKVTIGTFRLEHLQTMYKFPTTFDHTYGAEFLDEFKKKECVQYGKTMSILIKDWVSNTVKFIVDTHDIYSIIYLEPQYKYVAMMTYRLYGKEDTSHFFLSWVPLMFWVVEGSSFDWENMLSDSLTSRVTKYRAQKENGKVSSFFMSAYIMDAICSMTPFPLMSWSWNSVKDEPIHVYHAKLWEKKRENFCV
jgi:hypothetical protein